MLGREEFMSGKINDSFKKIYCNREQSNGVIPKTRKCSQEKGFFPVEYEKEARFCTDESDKVDNKKN